MLPVGGCDSIIQSSRDRSDGSGRSGGARDDMAATTITIDAAELAARVSAAAKQRGHERQSSQNNLFHSIWKTFKQTFENTATALSSSGDDQAHAEANHGQHRSSSAWSQQQQQKHNHKENNISNRRVHLLEKTLHQHYVQRFLESSSPDIKRIFSEITDSSNFDINRQYPEDAQGEPARSSQAGQGIAAARGSTTTKSKNQHEQQPGHIPFRWRQQVEAVPTEQQTCHCFSESQNSYWSFQWCPQVEIFQGQSRFVAATKNDKKSEASAVSSSKTASLSMTTIAPYFTARHSLGRWVGPEPARLHATHPAAARLWLTTQASYPSASLVELYVDGDPCDDHDDHLHHDNNRHQQQLQQQRRMSVVVLHHHSADLCTTTMTSSDPINSGVSDFVIENVEEPKLCQYVVHVCIALPPSSSLGSARNEALPLGEASSSAYTENNEASFMRPITQSDLRRVNQTLQTLQTVIHPYLGQSEADVHHKAFSDVLTSVHIGLPPLPPSRVEANKKLVRDMFMHAYDGYMYNAYPASEVKPITCGPAAFNLVKIPALTLIDSLDMLILLNNFTEFARSVERLRSLSAQVGEESGMLGEVNAGLFSLDQNVSVFETNIRVLGGLLSAHQLAEGFVQNKVLERDVWDDDRAGILSGRLLRRDVMHPVGNDTRNVWVYDGFLLQLARDIGDRLLRAFDTKTGIPYGTVNLLSGVPKGETPIASLAGGGTLTLEMELLSRLTGNEEYGRAAKLATRALWMRRSSHNLFGKHICTRRGEWTETLSGIGSNSDSFYEYLMKHHILFPEDSDFWLQLVTAYGGVFNESRMGEWYGDVDMSKGLQAGGGCRRIFEALMAFYPGLEVLLGEVTPAARTLNSFFLVREYLGFLPERFNYAAWKVESSGGKHLLRPELLESAYFLHQASKGMQHQGHRKSDLDSSSLDYSGWQWAADFALHTLEEQTRVGCGYASIRDLSSATTGALHPRKKGIKLMNEMPSYFLSETLKYLYLIFDAENLLHTDENRDWVFTTEAHPIHHEHGSVFGTHLSKLSRLHERKDELQLRLRRRAERGREPPQMPMLDVTNLEEEKWTEASPFLEYLHQMGPIEEECQEFFLSRGSRLSTEPLLRYHSLFNDFDTFDESSKQSNPSYLTYRKMGNGPAVTQSCQNIYSSIFLWERSLNGGITDYADAYMSRLYDEVTLPESRAAMLGSVDALALYGTGVHVEVFYDETSRCRVREPAVHNEGTTKVKATHQRPQAHNSAQQFDMGEGMGSFEVSAFSDGSGFMIQQVDTSETLVTTLIEGEELETFILVYSSQGLEEGEGAEADTEDSRSAVMADLNGNAYFCTVELIASGLKTHSDEAESEEGQCINESLDDPKTSAGDGEILATFPCSPGLFGSTRNSLLEKIYTRSVLAPIRAPELDNEYGCKTTSQSDSETQAVVDAMRQHPKVVDVQIDLNGIEGGLDDAAPKKDEVPASALVCENKVVTLVHRGICTFQEKSMAQKFEAGAQAVIVINSEEEELFVMSGGTTDGKPRMHDDEGYPITVLVSGSDGQSILDIINESEDYIDVQLMAKVSIVRDETNIVESNGSFSVVGNQRWPGIRASPESLQIFSKHGWGVHAIQRQNQDSNQKGDSVEMEWQLFLMKHEVGSHGA